MNLLNAWGNFSVLVATATDGAISRANGDFVAFEGVLRGHNSLVNHALAGTCVPYSKEVQRGNLALCGQSFLLGFAHLFGGSEASENDSPSSVSRRVSRNMSLANEMHLRVSFLLKSAM